MYGRYPLSWAYKEQYEAGSWGRLKHKIITENNKYISVFSLWTYPESNINITNILILHSCDIS